MLEPEETLRLIGLAQSGDEGAKEILVSENMPLIKSVVKRYVGRNVEYDDLLQLGSMGLLKAVLNFDTSFSVRFSTYAVPMIAGEIKRYLRDDGTIKVSRALKVLAYKIARVTEEFKQKNNREPTVDEIANAVGAEKEEVVFAMDSARYPLPLYDSSDDDGNPNLIDKIVVENNDDEHIDRILLNECILHLSERDKKIILLRYFRDKTQSEVATALGVSQVQISRLESKILEKMKSELKSLDNA
jgi:RNA polymerase sigma factor, sigma-70 family/RNA polymerase sigma-70 factor, sigma-B/F/G subfamily